MFRVLELRVLWVQGLGLGVSDLNFGRGVQDVEFRI